jgi:hypothetical protein
MDMGTDDNADADDVRARGRTLPVGDGMDGTHPSLGSGGRGLVGVLPLRRGRVMSAFRCASTPGWCPCFGPIGVVTELDMALRADIGDEITGGADRRASGDRGTGGK